MSSHEPINLLVLDNYDSFTYNLVHILRNLGVRHEVYRNDEISVENANRFQAFLLSPGPGIPSRAGIMPDLIATYAWQKPIFGICLGHQALAEYCGATLRNMPEVHHGVQSTVQVHRPNRLFTGIPDRFTAGRYHSWEISRSQLPDDLRITAEDDQGCIMAVEHKTLPLFGVQFHPESIMTQYGPEMLKNFIAYTAQFH